MTTPIALTVQPRDPKMTTKALRRAQLVPGVIYGRNLTPKSVQCSYTALIKVLRQAGTSRLIALSLEGEGIRRNVLIREVQRDPITSRILHVDFYATTAGQKLRLAVPLVQRGEAPAERMGGIVSQVLDTLEVECLPEDVPAAIDVDLSKLTTLHSRLTVKDLDIPSNITVLTPADAEVVHVAAQRLAEEAAPTEETQTASTGTSEPAGATKKS